MASIGLGTSNLWNMRGVNTNLTKKTAPEENQNKDEAVKTPVLDTGTPIADLPRVPVGTLLANNGVTISTQAKNKDYKSEAEFEEDFAQGKYQDGQTGTIDGRQYVIKDNTMYYID